MKSLKVLALCALLTVSGQSFAKLTVTPIVFAKGSSCGVFEGNVAGRVFTLQLNAKQDLTINVNAFKPIYPVVKSPNGMALKDVGAESYEYVTKQKGKHEIIFGIEDESYPFAEVKFCAY